MRLTFSIVLLPLVVGACASQSSSSSPTVGSSDVGAVIETSDATVVSSREVQIEGDTSLAGPGIGGAAGAISVGSAVSGNLSGLAAVVGGLAGAGAGYLIESQVNSGEGIEYVLRMEDGRTVTLVQNKDEGEAPIEPGTPVLVQVGSRSARVMEHPSTTADALAPGAGGDDWVDPDTMAPNGSTALGDDDPTFVPGPIPRSQQ